MATVVPEILVDSLVQEIREKITQLAFEEILLPPSTNEFSEKRFGITWTGKLILTNGKFRGLQTLHRVGDAKISFNENILIKCLVNSETPQLAEMVFTVDLGLTDPTTVHDFLLIFLKQEMEGVVNSTITSVTFTMVLGLNLLTRRLRLIQFKFKELGDVNAEISGLGTVMDYIASKVTKVAMNRIKWEVATDVEAEMKTYLNEILNGTTWPSPESPNIVVNQVKKRTLDG